MAKRRQEQKRSRRWASALKGKTVELDIRDMAHGGKGLGIYRGAPVFVPYTLPGESITAEITGGRGKALFGRGLRLNAASGDRVEPRCSHFGPGRCWGCQWQHIDYAAQLLLKQDVLADQLARVGKLPDKLIESVLRPVLPAPERWAYNHSLSLLRAEPGGWGLKRQERGIEAISECHVAHPDLINLLLDLDLDYQQAQRMTLRRGSDGRKMLIFEINAEEAPALSTDLPLSVNLILPDREPINLIGDAHSMFQIAGRELPRHCRFLFARETSAGSSASSPRWQKQRVCKGASVYSTSTRAWAYSAPLWRALLIWSPWSRVIRRR